MATTTTTTTEGPDMGPVWEAELAKLRKEEAKEVKARDRRGRKIEREMQALTKAADRRIEKIRRQCKQAHREEEKALRLALKPLRTEWHKWTRGLAKGDRVAALRKRIAQLEGRLG